MRRFLSLALMVGLGGCSLFKKPKPAPPAVITPPPPPKPDPPKPLAAPPKVATQTPPAPELPGEVVQTPIPQAPPKKRQPSRNQKKAARTAQPPPQPAAAPPVAAEPAPPPQLTTIVTPAEQQRLHQEIDSSLRSAETDLASIASVALNGQQKQNLRRANSFIKQAHEMRANDPATALTLAKRAEALARDLASAAR